MQVFEEFASPVDCDTVVASVVHTDWHPAYPYPIPGGDREKELEEALMEQARAHANEGAEELRRAAFTSRPVVLVGRPPAQLLKEADNQKADLIVVGSRGYGPLGRALMGSVSDQVSRHARAVLVGRRKRE
jgi:nucleotide-binding universal stress UspA family protein